MKRVTAILLMLILCVGLLQGCGSKYDAEESTVFVLKDGKIVSTDVDDFDEAKYDEEGLEEYVNRQISEYNDEYGKDSVKLNNISIKDGKAFLTLEYNNWSDYARFYGVELFSGSITDALTLGYTFDAEFAYVKDGEPVPSAASEFFEDNDYKVVIIKANTNVQVKGKIYYVSAENVSLIDKKTVSIKPGNNLFAETEDGTEVQPVTEVIIEETEADTTVDEGSVGEDELAVGTEEPTEIVFEFEEEPPVDNSEFSTVYTYIIYK